MQQLRRGTRLQPGRTTSLDNYQEEEDIIPPKGAYESLQNPISNTPPKHTFAKIVRNIWLWEISSAILSLLSIAAIFGVLIYENGKELNQWGLKNLHINPNAVIAFLGAIAKSSLLMTLTEIICQLKWLHYLGATPQRLSDLDLFDKASRSPWGALKLSVRANRKAFLATCAALIVLLSILMDPFFQLVFNFPQRPTLLSPAVNATLRTCSQFDAGPYALTFNQALDGGDGNYYYMRRTLFYCTFADYSHSYDD